jgi:hypothetical protein
VTTAIKVAFSLRQGCSRYGLGGEEQQEQGKKAWGERVQMEEEGGRMEEVGRRKRYRGRRRREEVSK